MGDFEESVEWGYIIEILGSIKYPHRWFYKISPCICTEQMSHETREFMGEDPVQFLMNLVRTPIETMRCIEEKEFMESVALQQRLQEGLRPGILI